MSNLRAAMEPGSYLALYGHGYRLTEGGIAECETAIADERRAVRA